MGRAMSDGHSMLESRLLPATDRPLYSLLEDSARHLPDNPATDFMGARYTYRELNELVDRLANGLIGLGIRQGVHVGLLLPNTPYFVVAYFAILKAGATVVAFNPLLAVNELAHQIADSECKTIVTLDLSRLYEKVNEARKIAPLDHIVLAQLRKILPFPKSFLIRLKRGEICSPSASTPGLVTFEELVSTSPLTFPAEIAPNRDIAVLLYTGGTTGVPKGVSLTHRNLLANALQTVDLLANAGYGDDRVIAVIPFFHAYGMTAVMNCGLAIGAELILQPRFKLKHLLEEFDRTRPTYFLAVPSIYAAINASGGATHRRFGSLKLCSSGGDTLPETVRAEFEASTCSPLVEGYGLSEASPVVISNRTDVQGKPGSIGRPVVGTTVTILDPADQRVLPSGQIGEICVSGPQVMSGYWHNPEATATALAGGVLHTGDLGYCDEDGFVFLVDRIKDVIMTGADSVFPSIVEATIREHPAVADAAVVGVPDEYWGQRVTALVVPVEGQVIGANDLEEFLKNRLSSVERPKAFHFRSSLPRSTIGKVLRNELVAEFLGEPSTPEH